MSEFWGGDLALRVWVWLSQMCRASLYMDLGVMDLGLIEPENFPGLHIHSVTRPPNRHGRRMIARRARGIMPASHYRRFGAAGPLRAGASSLQIYGWVRARGTKGRFQSTNVRFYVKAFFRRAALWRSRKCGANSQFPSQCHALLSPD